MEPSQLENLQYRLKIVADNVCNNLCRYPREIKEQEVMDEICEKCIFNSFVEHMERGKGRKTVD